MIAALGLALLLALALSGLFTASELAIFSLGEGRTRALAEDGVPGSEALAELRRQPDRLILLLRAGDAVANVFAATAGAVMAFTAWGLIGLLGALAAVPLLVVLFGALVPMRLAAPRTTRLALAAAPPLRTLSRIAAPALNLLERVTEAAPGAVEALGAVAEGEARELSMLSHTDGDIDEHERQLIERAIRLDDTKAWDVMTPRVDIFAWRDSLTLAQIAPELSSVPYSRVPVYGDTIDDTTGVLYLRDAYQALLAGQRDVRLRDLARTPLVVPGSIALTVLLRDFQARRIHLALVVDEYGGIDGLVTLEDVLEELVGEIVDETDVAEEPIVRLSRHEIVAAGDADLREINHVLNTAFPLLEHRSLNGYLLEELGRVPERGEQLERDGTIIEVLEATGTQVLRARLRRAATPEPHAREPREEAGRPSRQQPASSGTAEEGAPDESSPSRLRLSS